MKSLYGSVVVALVFAMSVGQACQCGEQTVSETDGSTTQDAGAADNTAADSSGADSSLRDSVGSDVTSGVDTSQLDAASVDTACPTYQERCDGVCISVVADPDNCGTCNHTCTGDLVCVAGNCVEQCPTSMRACDNSCVDTMTDNLHCGDCITVCGDAEGCVEGRCEDVIVVGPGGACVGGGPVIEEPGIGGEVTCTGYTAQVAFRWSLCSCSDIHVTGGLITDAYDSRVGSYQSGNAGGGVGLNGVFTSTSTSNIDGSLWGSSSNGMQVIAGVDVAQELHLGGPFASTGPSNIGMDSYVNGDVQGYSVDIVGDLHVPASASVAAGVSYANLVQEPVNVAPPCDCESSQLIPVADIVAARASNNDNASIGLDSNVLVDPNDTVRLDLPCGRYYLDSIGGIGATIVAHGHVALYVGGNVNTVDELRLVVDPTSTFDIYVAGDFFATSGAHIGSPAYPLLTRIYIGGDFEVVGGAVIGAFFYAAHGQVSNTGATEFFGGLVAGDYEGTAEVTVHYDQGILSAAQDCPGENPGNVDAGVGNDSGPGHDVGLGHDAGSTPGCSSCLECGNQACIEGACSPCTSSDQCCAPLSCVSGTCIPLG